MSNVVAMQETKPLAIMTPMDMLGKAIDSGAGLDMVERLMGLQERWEANEASKAFHNALAAAKAEIPPIVRNAKGHNDKRYADFAAIAAVIDPILGKHNLSYRFNTVQTEKSITVTCLLFGHGFVDDKTKLTGPIDTTGNKNPMQAIGSSLTYLQRYSLVQALGLAATNDDDGKVGGAGPVITADQLGDLVSLMESVGGDKPKFLNYFKIDQLAQLPAIRFQEAVNMLNAKGRK